MLRNSRTNDDKTVKGKVWKQPIYQGKHCKHGAGQLSQPRG